MNFHGNNILLYIKTICMLIIKAGSLFIYNKLYGMDYIYVIHFYVGLCI